MSLCSNSWKWMWLMSASALISACGNDSGAGSGAPLDCDSDEIERGGECVPRNEREDRDSEDPEDDDATVDVAETGEPDVQDVVEPDDTQAPDGSSTACPTGALRCVDQFQSQRCEGGVWVNSELCSGGQICLAGSCTAGAGCTPGSLAACASETQQTQCNVDGTAFEAVNCPEGLWCFNQQCGTQRCEPGSTRCLDDFTVEVCTESGETYTFTETCDRRGGRVCSLGECVSGCAAVSKDSTYVGCEYWSVDLPQFDDPFTAGPEVPHSVVAGNVSDFPAQITVESFEPTIVAPASVTAPAGTAATVQFPRADIEGTGITSRSFRIRTTEPIVAYQFNPLNNVNLFSNDASLLLPVNAIGREYLVMSWPAGVSIGSAGAQNAFVTVVATATGTTRVTVVPSCDVANGTTITNWRRGESRTIELTQGQVLNLDAVSVIAFPPREADFTGTSISSDKPIVVFAGHDQAVIGEEGDGGSNCCADHLEEQLFPISGWGQQYLAVHSPPRGSEPDYWRVLASEDNTRIVTTPPIAGLHDQTLNRGQFIQVASVESFEINATAPILVGQFLASQQSAGVDRFTGDPSFILAVPVEGFRDQYVVLTPNNYEEDWLTIIRPTGAEVALDGSFVAASSFRTIGTLNYEYAWIAVEPGSHSLSAAVPFGVLAYGYDGAVSYGFPAGLNVAQETP